MAVVFTCTNVCSSNNCQHVLFMVYFQSITANTTLGTSPNSHGPEQIDHLWTGQVWNSVVTHHNSHSEASEVKHDDVIKWKRYWPFVQGIHWSPVNSSHKGQWRGALMFSLICVWINGWVKDREAGDLRCYRAHYDVIVMRSIVYV